MSFRFTVAAVLVLVGALMLVTGVAVTPKYTSVECTDSTCVKQTTVDVLTKLQTIAAGVAATYAGLALAFGDLRWPRQLPH